MAKKKLNIFANPDYGAELCPVCSCEFTAPFGLAVCRTCGFVSWGCNMCPLDKFKCCGSKQCPIKHNFALYAVFSQKEFDSLPDGYKIYDPTPRNNYAILMVVNRVSHIYTERRLVGFTTIDLEEWRKGNHSLDKVRKIKEITFCEQ